MSIRKSPTPACPMRRHTATRRPCGAWRAPRRRIGIAAFALAMACAAEPPDGHAAQAPADQGCAPAAFAAQVLQRINRLRAQGAVCGRGGAFTSTSPLAWHPLLAAGAESFARQLALQRRLSHSGAQIGTLAERLRASGYRYRVAAENIASGQQSIDEVLAGWMRSEGHCTNIMNGELRDVGMACVDHHHDRSGPYWALLLGAAR